MCNLRAHPSRALFCLRNSLRRGSRDDLAGAGCGESVDGTLLPIALTIALNRGHLVVVRCLRLERVQAYTEYGVGMTPVKPDVRFCRLVQVFRVRTVLHHAEVLVGTPRVVGCPSNNGQIAIRQLELWSFCDLDARSLLRRRK